MANNVVSLGQAYAHIAAGTGTTHVATKSGYLHSVTINTKGATGNTLTLSDSNGTIAVIDTTVTFGALPYDIDFVGKLDAVSAAGTGADVTISYRIGP